MTSPLDQRGRRSGAVGGAVTAGRPRDTRIFAVAVGAALGAVCLLLGSTGSFMFALFGNV
ncbi:hypothetical protein AB0L65_60180 [Nonomuraea sp. NPDC052116]|uniref:hypothetical protein n=1 Tax=Nonomuraea sp. NPDC052116 TaxID=3155665 RepID=UPI00341C09B9